jgi:hypothetical protein
MQSEQWQRKIVDPINDIKNGYFNKYLISEEAIQQIEGDENTKEVLVIVNHLEYELDDSLAYDKVMARNINKGVKYFYVLPTSLRDEWPLLRNHLVKKGVSVDNVDKQLVARFLNGEITCAAIHGLAIYIGKNPYKYRKKEHRVIAIQYSPDYHHSFLVDTSNDSKSGTKAIQTLTKLFLSNTAKYKCHA